MSGDHLPNRLADRLSTIGQKTVTEWDATPAAVLVPFYLDDGQWNLLYTRRTERVASHRGQVSFPGGAIEPEDKSPEQAAVREAHEEIGLLPAEVEILGKMNGLLTVTQFHVTPVVARIQWPFQMELNELEVASAFGVPLAWLLDPDNVQESTHESPMLGGPVAVYTFRPYHDEVIWGVTARITVDLLQHVRAIT
ncbi:MAG: CoA pyrophosphatase [Anaerolineales bacterium]